MTWQDPGGDAPGGGRPAGDDDSLVETRTDWPPAGAPADPLPAPAQPPAGPLDPPGLPAAPPVWSPPPTPGPVAPGMTWAPPVTPAPAVGALEYAGTPARFVAWVIDGFLLGLVSLAVYWVAALFGVDAFDLAGITSYSGIGGEIPLRPVSLVGLAVIAAVSAVVSAAYFILQWSSGARATMGMRVLQLQIGDAADGRTISQGQAARRWLALTGWAAVLGILPVLSALVSPALLIWEVVLLVSVIGSPTKQGLHDRFAGTAMVQPAGGSGNGLVVGCVLIAGLLVLIALVSIVAFIFLGSQVSEILTTVGESI